MSRQISELCTLLVEEVFGQLASRVYQALLIHGRSSLPALRQRTRLDENQLRHGLAVLIKQHLVYWSTSIIGYSTAYEANTNTAYSIIRDGKYIRIVQDRYGRVAGHLISQLLLLGHARMGDLVKAEHFDQSGGGNSKPTKAHESLNGVVAKVPKENGRIVHKEKDIANNLNDTLGDLLKVGLICKVHESHFRTDADNRTEAERIAPGVDEYKGTKKSDRQAMWEADIHSVLDKWKYGIEGDVTKTVQLKKGVKRPLEASDAKQPIKRRRFALDQTDNTENKTKEALADVDHLDNGPVLRINHDKFAILLRSQHLADMAEQRTCKSTAKVYEKVLEIIEPRLRECRAARSPGESEGHTAGSDFVLITTEDIAAAVPESAELDKEFGKVELDLLQDDLDHPKKRRKREGGREDEAIDVDANDHDEEDNSDGDNASDVGFDGNISGVSSDSDEDMDDAEFGPGTKPLPPVPLSPHQTAVRSHLLLLSQHPTPFLTRNPRTSSVSPESWKVDFRKLVRTSQNHTISQTIVARYGTTSMRLVNILTQEGKLDEKTLSSLSLIREKEMRNKLTTMQKAGLLELQEVPRDNARLASRTNFLYFFDHDRCKRKLTEESLKTLTRLLERAQVEKETVKGTLEKASRSDVVGREEQLLSVPEREALQKWRDTEARIWGQVGRIDDMVALLRDF